MLPSGPACCKRKRTGGCASFIPYWARWWRALTRRPTVDASTGGLPRSLLTKKNGQSTSRVQTPPFLIFPPSMRAHALRGYAVRPRSQLTSVSEVSPWQRVEAQPSWRGVGSRLPNITFAQARTTVRENSWKSRWQMRHLGLKEHALVGSSDGCFGTAQALPRRNMQSATAADDTGLLNDAIGPQVLIEFLGGRGLRQDLIARANDGVGSHDLPVGLRANVLIAIAQKWGDQFEPARQRLELEFRAAVDRGAEADLPALLWSLSGLECWTGNWVSSAEYAQKGVEIAMLGGGPHDQALTLCARAMISACTGDAEQARADGMDALRAAEQSGVRPALVWSRHALGFLELSRGDHASAHRWMAPLAQQIADMGVGEPGSVRFVPDEIEALIGVGDLRSAAVLLERFEDRARTLGRTWALATGARCRGLALAAEHDLNRAARAISEAREFHQGLGMPLELGRTLLQSGRIHRRRREKRLAKESLEAALHIFDQLGAPLWAVQARSNLARLGLRPATRSDLSATETAVAELAAEGRTNREIAAAIFLSPKSVDGVILRVYDKLGIRSRAQLGSWVAAHKRQ